MLSLFFLFENGWSGSQWARTCPHAGRRLEAAPKRSFLSFLRRGAALLLLLSASWLYGQQSQTPYDIAGKSMNYLPASVEAAGLFKRVPDEVDYARGRVMVRIPLYEIKTSAFTLPIALSYTTGGIKVDQKSGRIGLGWQLEAEPMISREVRGLRDEQAFLTDSSFRARDSLLYLALAGKGTKDLLPDLFTYRTLTSSGKFILGMTDDYRFRPDLLTPEKVRLGVPGGRVGPWFDNEIGLTDQTGTVYSFGATDNARETTRQGDGIRTTTCWKVSRIRSVDGETIDFNYQECPEGERIKSNYDYYGLEDMATPGPSDTEEIPPYPGYWKGVGGYENYFHYEKDVKTAGGADSAVFKKWFHNPAPYGRVYAPLDIIVSTRPVAQILFPNGSVEFVYSDTDKTLQGIRIKDEKGSVVRAVRFTRHSEGYERYLLDGLEITDAAGSTVEKYAFDYYPLPAGTAPFSPMTKAVDYWGYFNGCTANTDLVPQQTVKCKLSNNATERLVTIGGAVNRWPSEAHTRAYSLASVRYPTGGQTVFHYELNRFRYRDRGMTEAGGLRIKEIVDRLSTGRESARRFRYRVSRTDTLEVGSMRYPLADWTYLQKLKKYYCYWIQPAISSGEVRRDYRLFSSSNNVCSDNDIYYSMVVETTGDGVTKHYYDNYTFWPFDRFDDAAYTDDFERALFKEDVLSTGGIHEYYRQDTLEKEMYDQRNRFTFYLEDMQKNYVIDDLTGQGESNLHLRELYAGSYGKKRLEVHIVDTRDAGSRTVTHTPEGAVEETVTPHPGGEGYGRSYWVPKQRISTDGNGDIHRTEYTYPFDCSGEPYASMVERHDVSTPVEEKYYLNGVLKKSIRRVYTSDVSGETTEPGAPTAKGYVLRKLQESTDANCRVWEDVETYDKYLSSGRPVQLTRRDGTAVSLIWGYAHQRVLAVIENVPIDEVKHRTGIDPERTAAAQNNFSDVYERLEQLQASCRSAKISIFRYTPLIGVTAVGQPDGRSTYYGYDAAGRLSRENDLDYQPVNTYEYHEKNR